MSAPGATSPSMAYHLHKPLTAFFPTRSMIPYMQHWMLADLDRSRSEAHRRQRCIGKEAWIILDGFRDGCTL